MKQTAIALVYLIAGFDFAHQHGKELHNEWSGVKSYDEQQKRQDDLYEIHSTKHGGHIGIVEYLYDYAEMIEKYLEISHSASVYDGVIQYELYEGFGEWVFNHPDAKPEDFWAMAQPAIVAWFGEEQNASLPVDAPRKESTMKISDLISRLASLRGDLGDVDVIVRGSRETSFVDAMEIRKVKTPKRTAVYIGKAPQQTPQE